MGPLATAVARLKDLMGELAAFDGKEDVTAEELAAIDTKTKEVAELEKKIEILKASEQARARQSAPADEPVVADGTVPAAVKKDIEKEKAVPLIGAAAFKAKLLGTTPLKILDDEGYGQFARQVVDMMKLRNSPNTPTIDTVAAEVLLPDPMSTDYIDLLRPNVTFFQGGPKRRRFTNGKYRQPRGARGASTGYVGEAQRKPLTDVKLDFISMSPKKLTAIVPITEEARDWPILEVERIVREELFERFAVDTDWQAWLGTGGGGEAPVGILNIGGIHTFAASAFSVDPTAPNIVELDAAAAALTLALKTSYITPNPKWAWVMTPRVKQYIADLRVGDTTGIYAYPEIRPVTGASWKGIRVLESSNIPETLGGTGDESVLALVDFSKVLYAEDGGMRVKVSEHATLSEGGVDIHLFQQDMYAIRFETRHDWTVEHSEAVAKLTNVRWGSTVGSP